MTNKEKSIHNLHQARTEHIRWVNAIKLLVSGIEVSPDAIALSPTESPFGKWFYSEAMFFSMGTSRMVIEEIEVLFLALHDKYMKIYPIYNGSKKKNLLGGLLGGKNKASEHEIELSVRYYEEIVDLSDKFKHKLRVLESQLLSLGEEKFDRLSEFNEPVVEKPIILKIPEPEPVAEEAYFYGTRGR